MARSGDCLMKLLFSWLSWSFLCFVCFLLQSDDELAIDVMDRLSATILESFIHLTGADQVGEFLC